MIKRKPPKKAKTLEKEIQAYVDWKIKNEGWPCIRIPDALYKAVFRAGNNIPPHVGNIISQYLTGLPDNIVCLGMGTRFFLGCSVENKSDVGKLHGKQKEWARKLNTNLVRTRPEIDRILKQMEKLHALLEVEVIKFEEENGP